MKNHKRKQKRVVTERVIEKAAPFPVPAPVPVSTPPKVYSHHAYSTGQPVAVSQTTYERTTYDRNPTTGRAY